MCLGLDKSSKEVIELEEGSRQNGVLHRKDNEKMPSVPLAGFCLGYKENGSAIYQYE